MLNIYDLQVEFRNEPLGIDEKKPRFSWKLDADLTNVMQRGCRLTVGSSEGASDLWDSGFVESRESNGVVYEGAPLCPRTTYFWTVEVMASGITDDDAKEAVTVSQEASSYFETGFMNPSQSAWQGAQWIGPTDVTLSSDVRGVFGLSAYMTIPEGSSRAGVVLGDADKRIPDRDNYFRFDLDVSSIPAVLSIFRVGIVPEDTALVPIATVPAVDYDDPDKAPVITEANRHGEHFIEIDVTGDCAFTRIDGRRVDVTERTMPWGTKEEGPRQINPFGPNDVNTYPRLNRIGFYVPAGNEAIFRDLAVRNLRKPCAVIYEDPTTCTVKAEEKDVKETREPSHTSIPMLRTTFDTRGRTVQSARLYATSRGIYECRVNGQRVTDTFFDPGLTQYDKHLMYQVYDITDLVQEGENALGVILASGWWDDGQTYVQGNFNYFGDRESFLGLLAVTYEDGTVEELPTDPATWKYSGEGPWKYASFFHGEHYDAVRAEQFEHFAETGFDDSSWTAPAVIDVTPIRAGEVEGNAFMHWPEVNVTTPDLIGQIGEGIYAFDEHEAVSVTEIRPGVFIYDMGTNEAGVPHLFLKGERGTTAQIRYAEILCPDLPEFEGRVGTLMVENLRDADCTDLYTFAGDPEGEEYMPRFTYRGWRYLEISGVSEAPALSDVRCVVLSSVKEMTGYVRVSDDLVNRFIDNVGRSMRANFMSVPTDCPQRNERMGWDGDTAVFARTAAFQADTREFYRRWLMDMRDLQTADGQYADIAPVGGGFGGFTYESSAIMCAWEMYRQYGDRRIVEENYDSMCAFMDFTAGKKAEGNLAYDMTLGDWLAPNPTDLGLICEAFYGNNAYMMWKMGEAIGRTEEAERFRKLYEETKRSFNETYFEPGTLKTKDDTQCSYALPAAYHMVDPADLAKVAANLAEATEKTGNRVMTGFFGTAPLCPVLTEGGRHDKAYELVTQTECPSWLYPVTQGATSIWERWDSYTVEKGFGGHNNMNSFNHYSLGGVLSWYYEYVLGIRRIEETPAFSCFIWKPYVYGFEAAEGSMETPYGTVAVKWKVEEQEGRRLADASLTVPANTTARVLLPGQEEQVFGSGQYSFQFEI